MKKTLSVLVLLVLTVFCASTVLNAGGRKPAEDKDVLAASALAARIVPSVAKDITFVKSDGGKECYEFRTEGKKLIIKGSSALSMAVGLNNYLNDYCNIAVSWYVRDDVPALKSLPEVREPQGREAVLRDRFFLNYCTYGYSLVWWGWKDWERFIDWMALNGVNMCLAQTGQEAVWQKVWMDMGLTAEQTREYFTGPAFLPWHRMTNIDAWHGPLPQKWIDSQAELQKKIISREVSLGIQPILTCFNGHVPAALKDLYPDADISPIKPWGAFKDKYQCHYLNPADPMYSKIQKKFLLTQQEFYGKDSHIYGVDPFNEIDPPTWDPDYLASVADLTYKSMAEVDPDAVWLQMAWVFYYLKKNWTPDRVKAYLSPVPKGKLLMLDYFCEKVEVYRETDNFYGQDFIWSYLGNFGENHMMSGSFKDVSAKVDRAFADAPGEFKGVGCTLEGLGVDPPMWEFVLDKAWSRIRSDERYIERIADTHLGYADGNFRKAWSILYDKCHVQNSQSRSMLHTSRPGFVLRRGKSPVEYDNKDLLEAWGYLVKARPSKNPLFLFDCTNVARQWLENEFNACYAPLMKAYADKDREGFEATAARMGQLLKDIEVICGCDPYFSLGRYIASARSFGKGKAEKKYYEEDARIIISTWGNRGDPGLTDYSSRAYDGVVRDYYTPRWMEFFRRLRESLESGNKFDDKAYLEWCKDLEWDWAVKDTTKYPEKAKRPAFETSRSLYLKYRAQQ